MFVVNISCHVWEHADQIFVQPKAIFTFKIAFAPQNLDVLNSTFWQISNPKSPLFGKHLTDEQIADLISLPQTEIAKVDEFLKRDSEQICEVKTKLSLHRDYLRVRTCVGQAESIFPNLKLGFYQRMGTTKRILRSVNLVDAGENLHFLGIPKSLHSLMAGVHDITDVPMMLTRSNSESEKFNPFQWFPKTDKELSLPEIADYFQIPKAPLAESLLNTDNPQVRNSVVEFGDAAFSKQDLEDLQKYYGLPLDPVTKIVGTEEDKVVINEVDLDVETITAIAKGAQTWDFVFDDSTSLVDVIETVMKTPGSPKTVSCSWGGPESDAGKSIVFAANTALLKLGLAGFTWINDAGDAGPTLNPADCNSFDPRFPAVSPYVLGVGGVKITKATGVEGAWFRSSGGFSNYFDRPAFQNEAVENYLSKAPLPPNPNGSRFSTTGRAFPDVAAFAAYFPIFYQGKLQPIGGGTSTATPQWAGLITLVNALRYQKGLGPLGPLAPTLYKLEKGVGFDVVEGQTYALSRIGCKDQYLPGFYAYEG